MRYEWDPRKAEENLRRHKVDFADEGEGVYVDFGNNVSVAEKGSTGKLGVAESAL